MNTFIYQDKQSINRGETMFNFEDIPLSPEEEYLEKITIEEYGCDSAEYIAQCLEDKYPQEELQAENHIKWLIENE